MRFVTRFAVVALAIGVALVLMGFWIDVPAPWPNPQTGIHFSDPDFAPTTDPGPPPEPLSAECQKQFDDYAKAHPEDGLYITFCDSP